MEKKNEILDLSFDFALGIIKLVQHLTINKDFIMFKQFFQIGKSVSTNITEAQTIQSLKDFIAKMSIAFKKPRKSNY
tara:strand:- start:197 stop:427 length:231 start_codon:yes stop_codon:yes gene_type:complete